MKIEVHNLDNHPTANFADFVPLQDDFKTRTPEQLEKLKNRIKSTGFKYDVITYISNKKYKEYPSGTKFILDAHGRIEALRSLSQEGYEVPEIPYTQVSAKNITEAKKEILYLNSEYGSIDAESMFVMENLDLETDLDLSIPELNLEVPEEYTTQDYSAKNQEIDTDEFADTMQMKFDFSEEEFKFVQSRLADIGGSKETAILKTLGYES